MFHLFHRGKTLGLWAKLGTGFGTCLEADFRDSRSLATLFSRHHGSLTSI